MSVDNVADINPINQYVASASQTEFDFDFPIFEDDNLVVYDNDTVMALDTDYTVSGAGDDNGGTVTFLTGRTADNIITIYRDVPIERLTDFAQNGPRRSADMNDELDRITMWMQQLERNVGRAVRLSLRNPQPSSELEMGSSFFGMYPFINEDGELVPAAAVDTTTLTQDVIADLLTPQTEAEALAGIIPTNTQYQPGMIDRYGTNTTPGTTDMSAAVQDAFNSGAEVRGISGSTYNCSSTTISVPGGVRASLYGVHLKSSVSGAAFLNITGNDVQILGAEIEGQGNGVATTSSEILIKFAGANAGSYASGLVIRDCYIHESGFYGVKCDFAQDIVIDGCRFDDIAYAAVLCSSCTRAKVNNNTITDVTPGSSSLAYGISFDRRSGGDVATYPRSKDCEAIGNIIDGVLIWEALDTHGGDGIVFANNLIRNCLYGINVGPDTTDAIAPLNITITGNIIQSGSVSASPGRAIGSGGYNSSNKASNIVCSDNVVLSYGANSNEDGAIMFQYVDGLVINGNSVYNSRGSAICLNVDNDYFVVADNVIRGIINGVSNAAGINIRNTTQTGHIAGNYIDATAEIGIYIANSNTGVTFGRNRISTSGATYTSALYAGAGLEIEGSTTTDVASIADGDQAQFNITVAGAELGDYVSGITCSISTAALSLTATVTAQDTVTAVLQNNTGGAVDLASATYTAMVTKR